MDQRTGTWRPGAVVWREAASADLAKTTAFYGALLGWTHHDSDMGANGVYRHFKAGDQDVAGAYQIGPQMAGMPSHWLQYVSVADVDQAAARAKELGAQIMMGPLDIPNVGRAVYVKDPQGAAVAFFRDAKGDAPAATERPAPGVFCWESVVTTDKAGASDFYQKVVGYQVGDFQGNKTLATGDGPMDGVADLGDAPPGVPAHWMSHVVVADLAQSRERALALGARILMAEIAIPYIGKIAIIADPVGAILSLYEPAAPVS